MGSFLKEKLKRKKVDYKELANRSTEDGTVETEASVTNKISRGTFSAVFMIRCLGAIGCQTVRLEDG